MHPAIAMLHVGLRPLLHTTKKMTFDRGCPRVNHGVFRENVIGEVANNLLGNPAKIKTKAKPRLNNDKMNFQMVNMVSHYIRRWNAGLFVVFVMGYQS
jgi:hypothetical protein